MATKVVAAVDACQEIAQNTVVEGAVVDLSAALDAALHIQIAATSDANHDGTHIRVLVSSNTTGDEDWTDLTDFYMLCGLTAALIDSEVTTDDPLHATDATILMASTTGYATNGLWRFLEDVNTFANSEWVYQIGVSANTSITIADGVTRQHAVNSTLWNYAESCIVQIPVWAVRVKVIYENNYDADGATVAIRCRLSKLTDAAA